MAPTWAGPGLFQMAMNPGRPTDPILEFFTRQNDLEPIKLSAKNAITL